MTKCMVLFAGLLLYQYHNLFINQDTLTSIESISPENVKPLYLFYGSESRISSNVVINMAKSGMCLCNLYMMA